MLDTRGSLNSSFLEQEMHLLHPASVSNTDYLAALGNLSEQRRQYIQSHQQKASAITPILNSLEDAIVASVGAAQWTKLKQYILERQKSNHGSNQFNLDSAELAKLEAGKRETRNTVASILKSSSASLEELAEIRNKYIAQISDVMNPKRQTNIPKVEIVRDEDVPQRIRAATEQNNPITKKPPYDGWYAHYTIYRLGGSDPTVTWYLDGKTGLVGTGSICSNNDAGDNDYFSLHLYNTLCFWKNFPTGHWDVWIKTSCQKARSSYLLANEWGWSDAANSMYAGINFTAETFPPVNLANDNPFGIGDFWNSYVYGVPETAAVYDNTWRSFGQVMWFHFTTPFVVPGKNGMFVAVGSYDQVNSYLNDTTAVLLMDNKWKIEQVTIDVK
jgi:hypothetical protein